MEPFAVIESVEKGLRRQDVTVDAFCKAIGIHRATWQRWKAGKTSPTVRESEKIIEVARSYGIELTPADFIRAA